MIRKILVSTLMCIAMILFAPLVRAGGPLEILTAWTDKTKYSASQSGTLYIAYNNIRNVNVTIRNINVTFRNWWAYDKTKNVWIGNVTYVPLNNEKIITAHTVRVYEVGFTVPSDGRARDTEVDIKVYTNLTDPDELIGKLEISVIETPDYMEKIITLFTIQVMLIIVCTTIISATIFLSARRPQVTWKKEEN